MSKLFSVLSWNVKHFKLKNKDVKGILDHIEKFNPDVMAIYEVTGKHVYSHMMERFPNHSFFITEGRQSQEILVGTRNKLQAFTTQRTEFNRKNTYLRPGTLTTFKIGDENYSLLFLHTKSHTIPVGFGIRDDQFKNAFDLKKKLDKTAKGNNKAKFIITGDLNTMGLDYPFKKDIDAETELKKMARNAKNREMKFLKKDFDHTWTNGKKMFGNLDHVLASDHILFNKVGINAEVKVSGWREYHDSENISKERFTHFVKKISDHNSLYFEIKK